MVHFPGFPRGPKTIVARRQKRQKRRSYIIAYFSLWAVEVLNQLLVWVQLFKKRFGILQQGFESKTTTTQERMAAGALRMLEMLLKNSPGVIP